MERGLVKWYNADKGYGFIQRDGGKDVFFHFTSIVDREKLDLSKIEGHQVEFDVVEGPKGPVAANVKLLN
ncbi:MAG: cold-shock protein [Bacteroidales bacterium]|nr:cold-shock protein [Bacteroidales bacterium]